MAAGACLEGRGARACGRSWRVHDTGIAARSSRGLVNERAREWQPGAQRARWMGSAC